MLHSNSTKSFIVDAMLWSTSVIYSALIDSGASGTFVSLELALLSKEIKDPIELQLFDSSLTSGLITCHHVDIIFCATCLGAPLNPPPTLFWCSVPL
ncbi:hypothetical protein C0995_008142 [Termitomyces sp. Mi166|nr:hypothetical protein C0995_008142 [Termitomyces sp. Mi166\